MPEYLTVREVAAIYRVNEITVRRHIRSGKLRAIKVGGRVRVEKSDVEQLAKPAVPSYKMSIPRHTPSAEDLQKRRGLAERSRALREKIGPIDLDLTAVIRAARDEDNPDG
jgi:excisionase family DNA binding protein